MKKLFALLLALAMVLSLCACGSKSKKDEDEKSSSYNDALKTYFAARFEGKSEKIEDLAPKAYWNELLDDDYTLEDVIEGYEDDWGEMDEYYKEEYGNDYRVTYEIAEKEKLDKETLAAIGEVLADEYDIDPDDVTAGYVLTVEATIKGSEDEDDTEIDLAAIEYDGTWYIIDFYDYGDGDVYADFSTPT